MKNGYFGIGIINGKTPSNIGTLWRSAYMFGADFIFVIGERYHHQPSDTPKSWKNVPLVHFDSWEDFIDHKPEGCEVVMIEQSDRSKPLVTANHPERCAYLLGAEDRGIPEELHCGHQVWYIDTPKSLNVAVAGSIVLYDRTSKLTKQ